jgi:hypothetical protein
VAGGTRMAIVKRKTRKKLSKQLTKLVKKHGAEAALALVTGIVSNLTTDGAKKRTDAKKAERKDKEKESAPAKPVVVRPRAVARVQR